MAGTTQTTMDRWRDWAMLVLAAWLFVSPWVLGFAAGTAPAAVEGEAVGAAASGGGWAAAWNAWIVGVIVAALAIAAAVKFAASEDWVNLVLGAWLVVSPWVLGFGALAAAAWNAVIVGALIAALAAWELWDVRRGAPTTRATA